MVVYNTVEGGTYNPSIDLMQKAGIVSISSTQGVGYATGAGGAVTQLTNKSTGVTLNTMCGTITMNNANLATVTPVSFTVTNSQVAATDVVLVNIKSGATANSYLVSVGVVATGSFSITLYNATGGTLGEAVVLNFAIVRGVAL